MTNQFLVTGAGGFVGAAVVERLLEQGARVRSIVRAMPAARQGDVVQVASIEQVTDWAPLLAGVDVVIHLAGRAHILKETDSHPERLFQLMNVDATERLARSASAKGVRRLVFLSSIGVHGMVSEAPITETSPVRPWNAYTESKWQAERVLRKVAGETGLEVVVIRPSLIYGERVKGNFLKLLRYIDRRIPLPLAGVANRRSLLGLENIADLILHCAKSERAAGECFVAADGEDVSTTELIGRLAALMQRRARLFALPRGLVEWVAGRINRDEWAARLYGSLPVDASKARNSLGWVPPVSLQQGLERTVRWYLTRGV